MQPSDIMLGMQLVAHFYAEAGSCQDKQITSMPPWAVPKEAGTGCYCFQKESSWWRRRGL